MKQYIVDAFTNTPFHGNPAAICVLDQWPDEEFMLNLASENNLSETAFIVKEEEGYHLRWFTPVREIELCGHATLASSFVIFNFFEPQSKEISFNTLSGKLTVTRNGDLYEMNFPIPEMHEVPVTDEMEAAFGLRPVKAFLGFDLNCVFEDENQVRSMEPNQELLGKLEGRIQNATAKGKDHDCVSRSFCPKFSIKEDPVCGSAHTQIVKWWSDVLGKKEILAYQASKRGGTLYCKILDEHRVMLSGEATLVAQTEIMVDPFKPKEF